MRIVPIVALGGFLAFQASAGVRALLPLCCGASGSLSVIDPETGAIEASLYTGAVSATGGNPYVEGLAMALTAGGTSAVVLSLTGSPTTVGTYVLTLVSLSTGSVSGPLMIAAEPSTAETLAVNPHSGVIYVPYLNASTSTTHLQVVNPATLSLIADADLGRVVGNTIVVSPNGQRIYLSGETKNVMVLDAPNVKEAGTIAFSRIPVFTTISPDGAMLYAVSAYSHSISEAYFADTTTFQVTQTVSLPLNAGGLAPSADGSQLYIFGNTLESQTTVSTISTLVVSTTALSTVSSPIPVRSMAVSAAGSVYVAGAPQNYGTGAFAIFDPVSQSVSSPLPLLSPGFVALSPSGGHLYQLNSATVNMAMTAAVPSPSVAATAPIPNLALGDTGAYDAADNLVLLPGKPGVLMLDGNTLKVKRILQMPASMVAFGTAGFALSSHNAQGAFDPQVVQFSPASLQVTGAVSVPVPASVDAGSFIQPAQFGNYFYAPFSFYENNGDVRRQAYAPSSLTPAAVGIAVIDAQTMTVTAIWPLDNFTNITGFAIAPAGNRAYVAGVNLNFINLQPELIAIDLSTGQTLKTLNLPGLTGGANCSNLVIGPEGGAAYVTMSGTLYAINLQTMAIVTSVPGLGPGFALGITPDGQYLYAASAQSPGVVSIVSTAFLQVTGTIPSATAMSQVLFTQ
jgi:hypothetical protein